MQNDEFWFDLEYGFADHHTENLEIFEVNTWVNLELYGTLIRVDFNGDTDCTSKYFFYSNFNFKY